MAGRAIAPPKKKSDVEQSPAKEPLSAEERIRIRAHELYVQRGGADGSEVDDWLQAEAEILGSEKARS